MFNFVIKKLVVICFFVFSSFGVVAKTNNALKAEPDDFGLTGEPRWEVPGESIGSIGFVGLSFDCRAVYNIFRWPYIICTDPHLKFPRLTELGSYFKVGKKTYEGVNKGSDRYYEAFRIVYDNPDTPIKYFNGKYVYWESEDSAPSPWFVLSDFRSSVDEYILAVRNANFDEISEERDRYIVTVGVAILQLLI